MPSKTNQQTAAEIESLRKAYLQRLKKLQTEQRRLFSEMMKKLEEKKMQRLRSRFGSRQS